MITKMVVTIMSNAAENLGKIRTEEPGGLYQ
jgi:hypothetical protein